MRVNHVKSARKEQGACESCRNPISIGDGYKYIAPRYGAKRKRHESCPSWKPSEMVGGKMAAAYAAQEDAHEQLNDLATGMNIDGIVDDVQAILTQVCDEGTALAEEYQESLDNMPSQLQDGPTAEDMRDKISALETWADELGSWSPDSDEPDENEDPEDWFASVIDSGREVVDGLEA